MKQHSAASKKKHKALRTGQMKHARDVQAAKIAKEKQENLEAPYKERKDRPETQIMDEIGDFFDNPLAYARYVWDWDNGELKGYPGPRAWQLKALDIIGTHFRNPDLKHMPCRLAVASGHGIGKTALIGMISKWGMDTQVDTRVLLTANTDTQIKTKTWPEINKWFRLAINPTWFTVAGTSIKSRAPGHENAWRMDAVPWNENNTEAFQGLHNKGKRIIVIYDEGSGVSDKIWEVTEGALTDENTEIIWIVFSNPTQNTGRFRQCFGKDKALWYTLQIDSRTVEGTNKKLFEQWAENYGEDSDFFRVRVKGEFPRAGTNQLIAHDLVAAARRCKAQGYEKLPRIGALDVARFGEDQSVLVERQGRRVKIHGVWRGLDTVELAEHAIAIMQREGFDALVVDGDGIGGGVCDHIKHRGHKKVFEFHGGATPHDAAKYYNRRAEIWGLMADWFKGEPEVPDDPELETDLCGPLYGYSSKGQVQLERKDDMKKRGLASPDKGDAVAMTFAVNVAALPRDKPVTRYVEPGSVDLNWMNI